MAGRGEGRKGDGRGKQEFVWIREKSMEKWGTGRSEWKRSVHKKANRTQETLETRAGRKSRGSKIQERKKQNSNVPRWS